MKIDGVWLMDGVELTCTDSETGTGFTYYPHQVTPILRPFEDLVKPLSNGIIPAVEIAKLAFGLRPEDPQPRMVASKGLPIDLHVKGVGMMRLYYDFEVACFSEDQEGLMHTDNQVAIVDYLRSQHFAMGLTPDQFIVKS